MTTTHHPQDRPTGADPTQTSDFPGLRLALVGLLAFVGLGGVFGGIQMLVHPYQPMGMATHMISRTPFDTFAVPGVLLLTLLGVAPLALAVTFLARPTPHPGWAAAFGVGLMAWIAVQWALVEARLWLQPVLVVVGAAVVAVAAALWHRRPSTTTTTTKEMNP